MKSVKEIKALLVLALAVIFVVILYGVKTQFGGCGAVAGCISVLVYGAPFQYYFIPTTVLILSLIPLFFTKEEVYLVWRKFSVWAFPIVVILIFMSPVSDSGNWGLNLDLTREMASILYSGLFLAISWALTLRTYLKTR